MSGDQPQSKRMGAPVVAGALFLVAIAAAIGALTSRPPRIARAILDGGASDVHFSPDAASAPSAPREDAITTSPDGGVRVTPLPTSVIEGEVQGADGRPIAGAQVVVTGPAGAGFGDAFARLLPEGELGVLPGAIPFPPIAGAPVTASAGAHLSGTSDAAGRFSIAAVPVGAIEVHVTHAGFVAWRSPPIALVVGSPAHVTARLMTAERASGRIADERGALPDAELWAEGLLLARSDGGGRFVVEVAGPTAVEVRARGHLAQRALVDPVKEIDVRLQSAAGRVTGVIVDERGFAVAGARVIAEGAGGERHTASSDAKGELLIEGTSAGPLRLVVTGPPPPAPPRPPSIVERVSAGDDVRVVLEPGGGVEGDARDADTGDVPRGLVITIEDAAGAHHEAHLFDGRGRFEALGLTPGVALLHASAPGYPLLSARLDVPPGDSKGDLTLRGVHLALHVGGSIAGTILDEHGAPAQGVLVTAGSASARTADDGTYRIAAIAPGVVELRAGAASATVTVMAGREIHADLRLP